MKIKRVLAACATFLTALGIIGGLAFTVHRRNNTIALLRRSLEQQGEDPDRLISVEPIEYTPVPVDHFYERRGHKILLQQDVYGEIWLPVLADVPLSSHPLENMKMLPNGRMISYDENGNLNALTGIDISSHNTVEDWNALKADGIDFVMLRAGYRGYGVGTGKLTKDEKFRQYYHAAKEAGLLVGAYFFSQAITEEEAVEEAILTAQQLEGCELDFPVAYDWELILHDDEGARTDNVPVDTLTDCVLAYCQNIEAFGYKAIVYQNKRTTLFKLDLPRIKDIPFWLAEYGDGPTYIYDYDMWQYSCSGTVAGISGNVDLNLCFRDFSQEGNPPVCLPAPDISQITAAPASEDVPADEPVVPNEDAFIDEPLPDEEIPTDEPAAPAAE
ncbi:MAG: glycoside hydrolase family 25 protein [Oscillospiraceae bacterium]|nr:glycoside hydrolase family 25 protein [Oscillospiraceae bacterium]